MTDLPSAIDYSRIEVPMPPNDIGRFATMGRWIGIIAKHDVLLGGDALALAVVLAEQIGPGFDRKVQFRHDKIAKRLNCDVDLVWKSLQILEEAEMVRVEWSGAKGNELRAPYVWIGHPGLKKE